MGRHSVCLPTLQAKFSAWDWLVETLRLLPILWASLFLATVVHRQRAGARIGGVEARSRGEQEFESIHEPKYQTFWIATDANGKRSVVATMPELIVGRRDGFWHVGVKQICESEAGDLGRAGP